MKYIRPNSLTWWASVAPLAMGVFVAMEGVHGLAAWAEAVRTGTGMTAPVLINAGLAGIGLRAAIK